MNAELPTLQRRANRGGTAALPVQDDPPGSRDLGLGRLRRPGRGGRRPLLRGLSGVTDHRRADQPGEPRRQALRPRSGARQGALGQERCAGRRALLTTRVPVEGRTDICPGETGSSRRERRLRPHHDRAVARARRSRRGPDPFPLVSLNRDLIFQVQPFMTVV